MGTPRASSATCLVLLPFLWAFASATVNVTAVGVPAINGSRVILTCTLSSTMSVDNVGYIWYTVENIEDYFSSGGSSGSGQGINPELTEIQRTQNLTFSPVLFSDHGEYVCGANFGGFEMLSDPFTLYVSPEGSVSVSADPSMTLYSEGDDITLNCSAQGGPFNEYQWTLNDEIIANETGPVLDLVNIIGSDDGGVYTCTVSNEAGGDEDSFTVNVSPVINLNPASIDLDVLVIGFLECAASGFPEPTYQWFKVGGEISENVTGEDTSLLIFNRTYYGDEGDYFCQVTLGDVNINSSIATLTLSPNGTVEINPENEAFSVGDDVNLTCSARGGPGNLFQWSKNGVDLEGENSTVLCLTNITVDDGSEYGCGVRNLGTYFNVSTFVFINPVITKHPSDEATTNGSNVSLRCLAEAFPNPTYQWTYGNGSEISSDLITGVNTTTLRFSPAEFGAEGSYVCTATANNFTATSDVATLFLSPAQTVTISPSEITASTGDNVTLNCSALGGPNNAFSWQREGISINVTTATLVISSITTSEGGDHMCVVTNAAGEGSAMVTLFIQPIITSAEDIFTANGTEVEFVCEADGIPSPNATWERIGEGGNTTVSSSSTFSLSPAVFGDEGDYQCVAMSTSGTTTETATLTISPEGSVEASPLDVSSERGLTQNFTCSAAGGPGNTFTWTRLRDSVVVSQTSQLDVVVDDSYDGGEYRCSVQNDAGNDTDDVVLRVAVAVDLHPESTNVSIADNFILTCAASAYPLPDISWWHNSSLVDEANPRITISRTNSIRTVESTITTVNATTSDGGTYVCQVGAPLGTDFDATDSDPALVLVQATPERPQGVRGVDVTSQSLVLQWVEPHNSNAPIIGYRVVYRQPVFQGGADVELTESETSLLVVNLLPGITYNFTVVAFNEIGDSPPSDITPVRTLDKAPTGFPQNVTVVRTTSTVIELEWDPAPIDQRNGDITDYEIELSQVMFSEEPGSELRSTSEPRLSTNLTGLQAFLEYTVRLRAVNSAGFGPFSPNVTAMTLTDRPDNSPQNVTATAVSPTEIEVSWEEVPPIDQNGIITTHEVRYIPEASFQDQISTNSVNITNTSILTTTLTGLEEYVNYNISVRAFTSVGPGPYSHDVIEITDEAEPAAAPQNVNATVESSTVIQVSWEEVPAIDENGEIMFYEVRYEPLMQFAGPVSTNNTNIPVLNTTLTGLEEYIEYSISVRAHTIAGAGPYSDPPVIRRTLQDAPSAPPEGVIADSLSSTTVRVNWSTVPPIDQNGIIQLYEVEYSQMNFTRGVSTLNQTVVDNETFSLVLRHLLEYVVYSVRVQAYTEEGEGPYSDAIYVTTDQDVPASAPVDVRATNQSATSILVTWGQVPAIDRNGIIISYDVEYTQDTFPAAATVQNRTVNDTMVILTGLQEYVVYSIRVRASTIVGSGPFSENVTGQTQEAAPASPPDNVNATAESSTMILVTWEDVPDIDQNGVITGYQVEYSQSMFGNTTQYVTVGDVRSVQIPELEEYVVYTVRVRASTIAGYGPYSQPTTERTLEDAPASPPTNVTATATSSTSIQVSWEEVPVIDRNGMITMYEVEYNQTEFDIGTTQTVTVASTTAELTQLLEYVEYSVRVRAYTEAGFGPYSDTIYETTLQDVPSSPPTNLLIVGVSPTIIRVTWDEVPPIERNGIITEYEVEYNQSTFDINTTQTVTVNSTMAELTGLHEYVDYFIRVRAYTRVGAGRYTPDINTTTAQDVPSGSPRNLVVQNSSANSLSVSWERPNEIDVNGVLVEYEIAYFIASTSAIQTMLVDGATLTAELENLNNYTVYNVYVYPVTIGRGPPVSDSERTSENVPGEAPLGVIGYNTSSTSINVTWSPPPPDVIFGILRRFEIRYFISSQPHLKDYITNLTDTATAFEIRGLEKFTNYSIEVSAVTIGNGPFSTPIYVVTDEDVPGDVPQPPEVLRSSITITTAYVTWEEPPQSNGVIIGYTINYVALSMASGLEQRRRRQIGGNVLPECIMGGPENINRTVEVPGDQNYLLLEDLTPFLTYEFSVQPETRIGRGGFSVPRPFETDEHVPTAPRDLTVEYLSSTSLEATWTHPQCDYGIRTGYMLDHSVLPIPEPPGTLASNIPPSYSGIGADNTSIVLEGLSPNTNYSISLCAYTSSGCSNVSTAINQTNEDAPLGVTNTMINFDRMPNSLTEVRLDISWTPPSNRNGPFETVFTYFGTQTPDYPPQRSNSSLNQTLILSEDRRTFAIPDGLPYAEYTVTLQPFNVKTGNRALPYSMTVRTIAIEPTVVLDLAADGSTSTAISVSWDLPGYPNGPISSYIIYYRKISEDTTNLDPSSVLQDPSNININGYSIKRVTGVNTTLAVISDLEVYRYYSIIVRAIGAEPDSPPELNGALLEVVARTFSDLPTEQPTPIQPDGNSRTTITITLPDHTYIDAGEVIFYAVVLIRGYQGNMKQEDYDDAKAFTPDVYAPYYITAAWSDVNVTRVPLRYVIGNESVTYANGVRYLNARLESGSDYSFFVRIDLGSDTGEPLRIRTNFTNLSTRDEIADNNAAGAAAGGVIVTLVAIAAAGAIILLIFFILRRRRSQKLDIQQEVALEDMASSKNSVTVISSRVIANPLAAPHRGTFEPIPVRNFSAHVVHLHSNDDFLFAEEYSSVDPDHAPMSEVCLRPENQSKNRYANIKAYDHSRVQLAVLPSEPGSDYINANRIDGYGQKNAFIATQGPVPATVTDFWRMVWEQGTATIVMLTNLEEKGRIKCHKYWPDEMERTKALGSIHVYFQDSLVLAEYTVRTLSVQMDGSKEERIVKQFHYTVWPDHGVPDHPTPLLQFVRKVSSSNPINAGPVIVHCSAGVGRTGTFITLDAQLKRIKKEGSVDIFGFVRRMRGRRCCMVQTEQQYIFLHDALLEAIECGVTEVAARDLHKQLQTLFEIDPATGKTGLQKILRKLQGTVHLRDPKTVSTLPVNLHKNRYADREMLPYDSTRCRLKSIPGAKGSDYINASYINGYYRAKEFIATQGPLPDTENDFWRMVWEQRSSTIVMLTKHKENDGKVKCHMYWPSSGAGQYDYLQVILIGTTPYPDYTLREFNIVDTRDESSRLVKHYQYTDWPENSVPETGSALIDLIGQVQRWQRSCDNKPIIVHCSGGCGRSGTYIAVSILIERLKTEGVVDVFQTVRKLRMQRPGMVASPEQYRFCYQTLIEFLDSFEMYANFK